MVRVEADTDKSKSGWFGAGVGEGAVGGADDDGEMVEEGAEDREPAPQPTSRNAAKKNARVRKALRPPIELEPQ
jgi:hypothetical protein